ncbi:MAG: GlsB/YeaQ/YmgE family stress response membrane protein [Candidatus Acidiferrales bacterium]
MLFSIYLLWVIVIGILAGWIAGKIMRGKGFGLLGDLIVGVIGSLLGSFIFGLIGLGAYGLIGRLVMAIVGAVILLWLIRFIKKA